jgi:hypothetical protein
MRSFVRFVFPNVLSRVDYSIRLLVCIVVVALLYYFRGLTDYAANLWALGIWNYIAFFVVLPRARQCGMPFIWAIFALVPLIFPFLCVALMFRPPKYEFRRLSEEATVRT